jgi:hypothetical protein
VERARRGAGVRLRQRGRGAHEVALERSHDVLVAGSIGLGALALGALAGIATPPPRSS